MFNDEKEKDRPEMPSSGKAQKDPKPKQKPKKIPDKPVKKPKIRIINEERQSSDEKEEY